MVLFEINLLTGQTRENRGQAMGSKFEMGGTVSGGYSNLYEGSHAKVDITYSPSITFPMATLEGAWNHSNFR
jgi:hypothetical protein